MQHVMDGMSRAQRQQLRDMMVGLIGDDRLRVDLTELAMNLEMLSPSGSTRTKFRLSGDEPLSLAEAMHLTGTLQEMDELENQIRATRHTGDIESLDAEKMRELVGEEEAEALREIQSLMKQLEEEGLVRRDGERYELTARGIRRIGQKALEDIFAQLQRDAFGRHRIPERGYGGARRDETKTDGFRDPVHLHLERTLVNGVARTGKGTPVQLAQGDFRGYRTHHRRQSPAVPTPDVSWSKLA